MDWKLPANVDKVECLFSWLVQLLNDNRECSKVVRFVDRKKSKSENANDSIRRTVPDDDKDNDDDDDFADEGVENLHPQNPSYAPVLTIELIKSCKATFLGKYEESRKRLNRVQGAFASLTGEHSRLLRVFQYCLETLEWCIIKLERQDVNEDVNNDVVPIAAFRKEWEDLQRNNSHRAVIVYMKGRLENHMLAYDPDRKPRIRKEILDLDPDYYIWWTTGYQDMRKSRRQYKRPQDKMKAPCKDEIDYCDRACNLAPDIILCTYNKAIMLKDIMFVKQEVSNFDFSGPPSPLYEKSVLQLRIMCYEALNEAERMAAQHGMQRRTMQIYLQKIDILIQDNENYINRKEGVRLLHEAIRDDPTNAHFYYHLGKVYQYGLGRRRDFKDVDRAQYYLMEALNRGIPCTFTCIQSYIRLVPHLSYPLPIEETFQLLNLHHSSVKTEFQYGTVSMWKAFLEWLLNSTKETDKSYQRKACMEWLDTLWKYANEEERLLVSLQGILQGFSRSINRQQFIDELNAVLETIGDEASRNLHPPGYKTIVERFLGAIQIWEETFVHLQQHNRQREREQNYRQPWNGQRGNGRN